MPWWPHPRSGWLRDGLRSTEEGGSDSSLRYAGDCPKGRSPHKSRGWCESGTGQRSHGVVQAANKHSGARQGRALGKVPQDPRAALLAASGPSELIRPGAAVIRLKNQLASSCTADFALHQANTVHLQKVSDGLDIAFANTISTTTKRHGRQRTSEDFCLQRIALSAKIKHALQKRLVRDVGVARCVDAVFRTFAQNSTLGPSYPLLAI